MRLIHWNRGSNFIIENGRQNLKIINQKRVESKLIVFKIHSILIKDKVIPYCKVEVGPSIVVQG